LELQWEAAREYLGEITPRTLSDIAILKHGRARRPCAVIGSPIELAETSPKAPRAIHIRAHVLQVLTYPLSLRNWPKANQLLEGDSPPSPDIDIFLDYQPGFTVLDGKQLDRPPTAPGLSGGGIWDHGYSLTSRFWKPSEIRLFGIQSGWQKERGYLRGVQIVHWLRIVHAHYPETRAELEESFKDVDWRPTASIA
jgi:hypothetical protein